MFKELGPLLRQRTVVMILTRLEDDTIRVNVIPRKLNESENDALTTPLSVAGTAEELDAELPSALVQFVGTHLELKNTLESAKEQMAAAAKAAKAEARSKATRRRLRRSRPSLRGRGQRSQRLRLPSLPSPGSRSRHAMPASLTLDQHLRRLLRPCQMRTRRKRFLPKPPRTSLRRRAKNSTRPPDCRRRPQSSHFIHTFSTTARLAVRPSVDAEDPSDFATIYGNPIRLPKTVED